MDTFCYLYFMFTLLCCLFVPCSHVITFWERNDLLCVVFSCFFFHFPILCSRSGMILDCIDSLSLPSSKL